LLSSVHATSEPLDARLQKLDTNKNRNRENRQYERLIVVSETDHSPDRRQHPDYGGCRHPSNNALVSKHYTGTQEPDASDELSENTRGISRRRRNGRSEMNENGGPQADENARANPGGFSPNLPFEPDNAPAQQRGTHRCPKGVT